MPQTNEVLRFTQLIGPFYEFVDDQPNEQSASIKNIHSHRKKTNSNDFLVNGTGGGLFIQKHYSNFNLFFFWLNF